MMKKITKPISIILSVLMLFGVFAITNVGAAEVSGEPVGDQSGSTGMCEWAFESSTGTLSITGSGRMTDYISDNQPWLDFADQITRVVIGDGVTMVGEYAFFNMNSVKSLYIGNAVESIGYAAFSGCDLSDISIPASVTDVNGRAFENNPKMTVVTIPMTVTYIDQNKSFGFYNGSVLEGFVIRGYAGSKAQSYANMYDGITFEEIGALSGKTGDCDWDFNQKTGVLTVSGTGAMANYTLNSDTKATDAPWWDYREDITKVVIGNNVTAVGDNAFYKCKNLKSINFGRIKTIGMSAFTFCGFEALEFPLSLTEIKHSAFSHNYSLASVTFGSNLEKIESYAFYSCALTELTLPDSLTEVGYCAFAYMENLKSVTVPPSVTTIGDRAFGYYIDPIEGFTIKGYSGTAAETYADENGFTFVPLDSQSSESVFVVTGDWLDGWNPKIDQNVMTKNGDGIYEITLNNVSPSGVNDNYSLKVVEFVDGDEDNKEWYGMDGTSLNYEFRVLSRGDVTVTYDPASGEITATGPTVADPAYDIEFITAVGNGSGNWLNGASWEPDNISNRMTEVSEGVYEITYSNVPSGSSYAVKFSANGGWDINWGTRELIMSYNTPMPADYDANNINFAIDETTDVTLRLDLTKMNWSKKTGAKFTVTLGSGSGGGLTVTSTSNFYGTKSITYEGEIPSQVIVDYYCDTDAYWLYNGSWTLNYDPNVLQFNDASNMKNRKYTIMPISSGVLVNNMPESGKALFSLSNVNGVALCAEDGTPKASVHLVFDVVGTGSTVVDLDVRAQSFMEPGQEWSMSSAMIFDKNTLDGGKAAIDQLVSDGAEIYTVIQPDGSSPSVLIGDVNNDGFIDVQDATLIQKYAVKKIDFTDVQKYVADVNNDGFIDVQDATLIQKYAVKKITEFPKKVEINIL